MSKNDELKRLAEAATAGPWSMCGEADGSQGFEIIQDIWNEHGTHTGKDVVVYEWSDESDPLGVIHRADAEFIAAANPVAVLALIADSNRLESEAVYAAAGFNAAREEIAKIHAEVAGLRTGYEAYERVNAELKADNEALRKDAVKWGVVKRAGDQLLADEGRAAIWSACSRILISVASELNYGLSVVTEEGVTKGGVNIGDWRVTVERIDAALVRGEQS